MSEVHIDEDAGGVVDPDPSLVDACQPAFRDRLDGTGQGTVAIGPVTQNDDAAGCQGVPLSMSIPEARAQARDRNLSASIVDETFPERGE
ncbi:hypothetical protein GCM10007884_26850 [Methylobacterium brachythecii]|uniref:Uncharacterized protein n=1 Tax=Methylobacterium brachythecii TaxID=1176177 RepID=A0ABQ6D2V2_9HYPH|nr:hypothetical protein GCM10007884_26850 [Methylobacterium brachythecii]